MTNIVITNQYQQFTNRASPLTILNSNYNPPSPLNPHQSYGQTKTQQLSADHRSDFGSDRGQRHCHSGNPMSVCWVHQ